MQDANDPVSSTDSLLDAEVQCGLQKLFKTQAMACHCLFPHKDHKLVFNGMQSPLGYFE